MSYVEVFEVRPNGDVCSYGEAHNNHGFAPQVWQHLGTKHGGVKPGQYIMAKGVLEPLWDMFGTDKLTREENILLGSTFDRVWIRRELIPELIQAIRNFHTEYIVPHDYVQTAAKIADILEQILQGDAKGVAFNCCSAVSSFWNVTERTEDDERSYRAWNVDRDTVQSEGEYVGQGAWELSAKLGLSA